MWVIAWQHINSSDARYLCNDWTQNQLQLSAISASLILDHIYLKKQAYLKTSLFISSELPIICCIQLYGFQNLNLAKIQMSVAYSKSASRLFQLQCAYHLRWCVLGCRWVTVTTETTSSTRRLQQQQQTSTNGGLHCRMRTIVMLPYHFFSISIRYRYDTDEISRYRHRHSVSK